MKNFLILAAAFTLAACTSGMNKKHPKPSDSSNDNGRPANAASWQHQRPGRDEIGNPAVQPVATDSNGNYSQALPINPATGAPIAQSGPVSGSQTVVQPMPPQPYGTTVATDQSQPITFPSQYGQPGQSIGSGSAAGSQGINPAVQSGQ